MIKNTIWLPLFVLFVCSTTLFSQGKIEGNFIGLTNQWIKLVGYEDFQNYLIDSVKIDANGNFTFSYQKENHGMAYLAVHDKSYSVILDGKPFVFRGEDFANLEKVQIQEGKENLIFDKYVSEHVRRENALSGWDYLTRLYNEDTLFSSHSAPKSAISKERIRIQKEDEEFLKKLKKDSYLYWYLPIRKLLSTVSAIAQNRPEEISKTNEKYRAINYLDDRLYRSGLLGDILGSQIWLIENGGYQEQEMYAQMEKSIDAILDDLVVEERKFNLITDYLFKTFEQKSLFTASEYLALKVLNEKSCTLDEQLSNQLESYRAMKIGNLAADIEFKDGDLVVPDGTTVPEKLSSLKSKYTVVAFGASWCPACQQEFPRLAGYYENWKKQGVEVVFISLDEDKTTFHNYTKILPFISFCDYEKWESKAAKDYYVFATPVLYLLNEKREIILRPNSADQLNSWVDWFLVKGEK